MKVLLNEEQAGIVEQDWHLDFELKQAIPREANPLWSEKIETAIKTDHHPDPSVEQKAREAFDKQLLLIRQGVAPRDAEEKLFPDDPQSDFDKQVRHRLWQLQVRSMHTVR